VVQKSRLTCEDIKGVFAIIPTPAKPGADSWSAENTVDTDELARVIDQLIRDGVHGLLLTGTLGECSTLTLEEHKRVMETAVAAAKHRIPVFTGTTCLNTRDTIMKTRYAESVGADGVMNGVPMWCAADEDTAVKYYRDLADACPNMAIIVYENHNAFKFVPTPRTWARLSEIPQVIGAKYMSLALLLPCLKASKGKIRLMPIDAMMYPAARMAPKEVLACWSSSSACGPSPALAQYRAIANQDWERAEAIYDDLVSASHTLFPKGDFNLFSMYNIPIEKIRTDEAGYMKAGPCRPPYTEIPKEYADGAREAGRRWAKLCQKYGGH
jgi:dihydrodipicolinate synthase/N-acetylneuraminate lyase